MQFIHQALAFGFLLALLPVLIHLINLMRHRRVKWAAMDFLLQSYKKHRQWVWLKQLLLLLMRMAAIALAVAMLAQWVTRGQWLDVFGGRTTHHYVLVDDSYSMSERAGGASAFDAARQSAGRIASWAAAQDLRQKLTLIRFSKARGGLSADDAGAGVARIADFNAETVHADFDVQMEELRQRMEVTDLAVDPRPALAVVKQLVEQGADENHVVYVLSDFRRNQWENPAEFRAALHDLEKAGAKIQLVNCTRQPRPNLGIVAIEPSDDTRAAGVPLFVNVDVKNYADTAASNVQLKIKTVFHKNEVRAAEPELLRGDAEELPAELIERIGPGETITRRVQVFFPAAGAHVIEASLPDDAVAADNHRYCVVDFPAGESILLVDGDPEGASAYYLQAAFAPSSRANTGIRPDVKSADFLRDASPDSLNAYTAIYLLDTERIDARGLENLRQYVAGGGGLGIFVGDRMAAAAQSVTAQMYADGEGLLPLPLGLSQLLPPEITENAPDIEVTDHPLFSALLGERNPLVRLVAIERYLAPREGWKPDSNSTVEIVAQLRDGAPLVVEKQFGRGRVLVFLTSAAPVWNNWARFPSFVVVALRMQSYLASAGRIDEPRLVGGPVQVRLEQDLYSPEVSFITPTADPAQRSVIRRTATKSSNESPLVTAALGETAAGGQAGETDIAGVYEALASKTSDGAIDLRRYAVNVDPGEGDTAALDSRELLSALAPVKPQYFNADELEQDAFDQSGYNRSLLLMAFLIVLLVAEQALAYSASYHPATGAAR